MFTTNESMLADNRTLIAISPTKNDIDRTLKNGTINYIGDSSHLYLTIPRSLTYGEYDQIITADINGIIRGNYTFVGDNIIVDTTNMSVQDAVIELNRGETGVGVSAGKAGFMINRGSATAASLIWNEATDEWKAGLLNSEITLLNKVNAWAVDINYANASSPLLMNVKDALDTLLYLTPQVLNMANTVNVVEKGSVVNSVTLSWGLNKPYVTSQSLNNGIGSIGIVARNYILNALNLTTDRTYTLTVVDEKNTVTASTVIYFRDKRYWGTSNKTSLASVDILALTNELATNRTQSRILDCTGGKYFYVAWPVGFGTPIFKVNGVVTTAFIKTTIMYTNSLGYATSYDIYRSQFLQNGSGINLEVL
jgi:hypothetical protein